MNRKQYQAVLHYVLSERKRRNIRKRDLSSSGQPELSCFAFGEAFNLVEVQLMYTRQDCGEWNVIKRNDEILELAYNYCKHGKKSGVR